MTSDLDVYHATNELIEQHDEAADIEAAMRADGCLVAGDMEGEAVWLKLRHHPRRVAFHGRPRRCGRACRS